MRFIFSYGMPVGTYMPKGSETEADSFDQAAKVAKDFYAEHPFWGEEKPLRICITSGDFKAASYHFETLEREY